MMNERIHACLDGDIPRSDLSLAELGELAALEAALGPATAQLKSTSPPDMAARVMRALPGRLADPVAQRAPWSAALHWLWRPRALRLSLRPAYALAACALLAVALPRALDFGSSPPPAPVAAAAPIYVQFRMELPGATRVQVAGTFTGWEPKYTLRETEPGVWTALIPMLPGVHDYSFVVDGSKWIPDPHAPQIADSFGGTNSRISLPSPGSA